MESLQTDKKSHARAGQRCKQRETPQYTKDTKQKSVFCEYINDTQFVVAVGTFLRF